MDITIKNKYCYDNWDEEGNYTEFLLFGDWCFSYGIGKDSEILCEFFNSYIKAKFFLPSRKQVKIYYICG